MMGTISYLKSNEEFLSHLDSVSGSLNRGGLYLIENSRLDWANKKMYTPQSWKLKRNGIEVKTTYSIRVKDALDQILAETLRLDVNDNGRRIVLKEDADTKMIFPQEFAELVKSNGRFELLGWFEHNETLRPLANAKMLNFILLRKK